MRARRKGRLAIYSDTAGGFGGNEYCAGVLAAAASGDREVCLHHHWQGVTHEMWSRFVGSDMSRVTLVTVPRAGAPMHPFVEGHADGMERWRAPFVRERFYSEGFEQFISIGHGPPPFNRAKVGAHYTQFPLLRPFEMTPFGASDGAGMKARGRRVIARWYWNRRMHSYRAAFANSRFTASWIAARWRQRAEVVYPPVPAAPVQDLQRSRKVCAVGRFGRGLVDKCALEMVAAYIECGLYRDGVSLALYGGLGPSEADRTYFEEVRRRSAGFPIEVIANADADELHRGLSTSMVYWHAAGLGIDPMVEPERVEHFGISLVEAMGHGCVPVVIAAGGPLETVRDGVDGIHCRTLGDMVLATRRILSDSEQQHRLAASARERARQFSHDAFTDALLSAVA
jgi:glycosyltransferase involved in cell wall biosynthesis